MKRKLQGGREKYSIFMKVLEGVVLKYPKAAKDEAQVASTWVEEVLHFLIKSQRLLEGTGSKNAR